MSVEQLIEPPANRLPSQARSRRFAGAQLDCWAGGPRVQLLGGCSSFLLLGLVWVFCPFVAFCCVFVRFGLNLGFGGSPEVSPSNPKTQTGTEDRALGGLGSGFWA